MPYGDFDVTFDPNDAPVATEQMRHLEGFDLPAQQTVSTSATQYLHGDLIRSTMLTTGQGGTAVSAVSYTAFGEVIGTPPGTRYQYAGGWGYETGGFGEDPGLLVLEGAPGTAPITLQHVGFRWYAPSISRFIQRDPLSILGGLNVYAYVDADPLSQIDPEGLLSLLRWPNTGNIRYGPSRVGFGAGGKGIYRLAFRVGSKTHIYGLRGALCIGAPVVGAAAAGAVAGRAADNTFGRFNGGYRISDGFADIIYRWVYGGRNRYYNPWGRE